MVGKILSVMVSVTVCAVVLGMNIQSVKSDVRSVKSNVTEVKKDLKSTDEAVADNTVRITRVEEGVEAFGEISRDIKGSIAEQRDILIDLKAITHELKGRVDEHGNTSNRRRRNR